MKRILPKGQKPKIKSTLGTLAPDRWLLFALATLLAFGVIMVTSASLPIAERLHRPLLDFSWKHSTYVGMGILTLIAASTLPLEYYRRLSIPLLLVTITLLLFILMPGVTRPINGSLRWLFLGPISVQPSEIAKVAMVLYMASYIERRHDRLQRFTGFMVPMSVLGVVAGLLLLEPDFGAAVVISSTLLMMMFLAGVDFRRFIALLPLVGIVMGILAFSSSYRVQRLVSFRNPWADQFDTGYQLVQSLIAFGRGGWFGEGLGNSIQKLLYLPESHSDFLFAVVAEELGLLGALVVLSLYVLFVFRALVIGYRARQVGDEYGCFVAYGIGLWLALQAFVNIGVNIGVLPTKGITLPLMSAGGSSLMITLFAVGILFRVDFETKQMAQKKK